MRAYDPGKIGCYAGWRRYEKNPIIGELNGCNTGLRAKEVRKEPDNR